MAVNALGGTAISLTGAEAGILTDRLHTRAKIANISPRRIHNLLSEDYIVIVYSTLLGHLGGETFTVLGSRPSEQGVIVTSRVDGVVSIAVDWQLSPSINGYKVTNLFVGGIDMASMQRSDLVSVVQRNSGHMQALLVALREKNASNGILR